MRSNTRIPTAVRCSFCKGWGSIYKATNSWAPPGPDYNHGIPLGHDDMTKCPHCNRGYRLNVEKVKGYVFCDLHGEVHPAEPNYYDDGEVECRSRVWRTLWVELM